MIDWSAAALEFFHDFHEKNKAVIDDFIDLPSSYLSLIRKDGALDLYHGVLRAVDKEGKIILHDVDYQDYLKYIDEEVRSWSYMKFPYLKEFGKQSGWYSVGPLARLNTAEFIDTPLAQKEFEEFKKYNNGKPSHKPMHAHWARLIEILHAAEKMKDLLNDNDLLEGELVKKGKKKFEGIGLIEAPRGTLFHHYKINDKDQITMCNLIVSTTNNNQPMNEAVNQVAVREMTGKTEISEGMMNAVEVAIRAYDPCLSCATHALGQMPLEIALYDMNNKLMDMKRSH
jgi:NAD-reducing hydrogenase large subunit